MRISLEAGFLARLLDIRTLAQKLLGGDDAELNHILHDREAGALFKDVAEIVLAQHEVIGKLVERQVLGAVLPEIVENRLYAVIVLIRGAVLLFGGADAAADQKQNLVERDALQDVRAERRRHADAQLLEQAREALAVFLREADAGAAVFQCLGKIRLRRRELAEQRGQDVQHIALEDRAVRAVLVAV